MVTVPSGQWSPLCSGRGCPVGIPAVSGLLTQKRKWILLLFRPGLAAHSTIKMGAAPWSALLAPSGTDPTTVTFLWRGGGVGWGGGWGIQLSATAKTLFLTGAYILQFLSPALNSLTCISLLDTWNCRTWRIMCLPSESPWKAVEASVLGSLGGSVLQGGLCTTVNKGL